MIHCQLAREYLSTEYTLRPSVEKDPMDGWMSCGLSPFQQYFIISGRSKGEHEKLCALKRRLGSEIISPPAGLEPETP